MGSGVSGTQQFEPKVVRAARAGVLDERVARAREALRACRLCPRDCGVDRLAGAVATCLTGRYAQVATSYPHFGEEDVLRGWRGSGTIFFGHCNLKCVFCQNFSISQRAPRGEGAPPEALAARMLELQARGCHNINLVTPEHVVAQIVEALPLAVAGGLRVPIVYNTSGYDAAESLALLDGLVDVYLADFKVWRRETARRLLKAEGYPEAARHAVAEMQRQVGDLVVDGDGIARRGLLVRHLVMPGYVEEARAILRWLAQEVSPDVYVNVMDQYAPAFKAADPRFEHVYGAAGGAEGALGRAVTREEVEEVRRIAGRLGIRRLDVRRPHPRLPARLR